MDLEQLVIRGATYEGPLPVGEAFLRLYPHAVKASEDLGLLDVMAYAIAGAHAAGGSVEAMKQGAIRAFRLKSHQLATRPGARDLFLQTFAGWTRNGQPITAEMFPVVYATPETAHEPWEALAEAWELMGFISSPGTGVTGKSEKSAEEAPPDAA